MQRSLFVQWQSTNAHATQPATPSPTASLVRALLENETNTAKHETKQKKQEKKKEKQNEHTVMALRVLHVQVKGASRDGHAPVVDVDLVVI